MASTPCRGRQKIDMASGGFCSTASLRLQMEAQCGDAEARALLEEAREALRELDAESLRLFNQEVSGGQ